jgi:hypothetical protein
MTTITDDFMREMLTKSKTYTVVLLKAGPGFYEPGARAIIWEHGRRNFSLRADGLLSIVCPVTDDSEYAGVGIFNAPADEVARLMGADPAVAAGVLTYEVHPVRGFPGDTLPASPAGKPIDHFPGGR